MQEQTDMQKLATRRLEWPRALPPTDTLEDVRKEPCKLLGMASDVTVRSAGLRRRALRSASEVWIHVERCPLQELT